MNKKIIFPKHSIIPAALLLAVQLLGYFIVGIIDVGIKPINVAVFIDKLIPLWTPAVIIYVLAFVQWVSSLVVLAGAEKDTAWRYFAATTYGIVICTLFFIFLPTRAVRPEIIGNGFCDRLLGWIYSVDEPTRLFPSLHCMESWMCARAAFSLKDSSKAWKYGNAVLAVLVMASTVLTKQHMVIDIPAGVAVAEIGIFIAKKHVPKVYELRVMN